MEANIMLFGQGIICLITGFIVEALKQSGLSKKYAMIASAGIGLLLGVLYILLSGETNYLVGVFGGLFGGAAASGFYSGGKELVDPLRKTSLSCILYG